MTNQNHLSFRILRSILLVASILCLSQSLAQAAPGDEGWSNQFFQPGLNKEANAIVVDSKGNIYAGGRVTVADDVVVNHITMWDGYSWNTLGTGLNDDVKALAVDSKDNLYVGGRFTTAGGIEATYIAMWDGTSWSSLGSGVNNIVTSITIDSHDNVYVSGLFTQAGEVSAAYIAKWDGSTWSGLGDANDLVLDLDIDQNDNLFAAGGFTQIGGVNVTRVAKWDGTKWSALAGGPNSYVRTLAVDTKGNVYVSGPNISQAGGVDVVDGLAKWDGSNWSSLGSGINYSVHDLATDSNGNLYVAGYLIVSSGKYIAKWDGINWSSPGGGVNKAAWSVVVDADDNVFVSGEFTQAGDVNANRLAKWDGDRWIGFGSTAAAGIWGYYGVEYVYAIATDSGGNVYAGGAFKFAGDVAVNYIAKWDGNRWYALGTGLNKSVYAIVVDSNDNLYVGGQFTKAGGVNANYVARWDGQEWHALADGVYGDVNSLVVDNNGNMYAGGKFTIAGGESASRVARWDGSNWSPLGSGVNGNVNSLVVDSNGSLYAGGEFTVAGGGSANRMAKWDGSNWSGLGSGINGRVRSLAINRDDYLYAGGEFTSAGGIDTNIVAKWDGSEWYALGNGIAFDTGVETSTFVAAITSSNNDIVYAGGFFYAAGGQPAYSIARWIESPILIVSPTVLNFTAIEGGETLSTQSFVIDGNNSSVLTWTISEDLPWLTVDQESGEQSSEINVSVDASGLSAGTYTGQITVSAAGTENSPQTVAVTLVVAPAPPAPPLVLTAEAGPTTIFLDWEHSRNPGVTTYRISRSADEGQTFAPIGTTFDLYYEDSDDTLLHNKTYCYQIEALRADESVVNTSTVACAVFGQTALWVPHVRAETKHTVIVPINIRNAGGLRIANSTIWLDYDQNMLYPVEVIATPLTAGYDWSYDITHVAGKPGFKRMHISASTDTPTPLYGNGSLFWLKFDVFAERGDNVTLDLREYIAGVGGSAIYTPDNPTSPIPIIVQDGRLSIDYTYLLGDVDGNGEVENADADLALEIAAGAITPRAEQLYAGDINGSGGIEAADATMILHYITYGDWPVDLIEAMGLAVLSATPVQLRLNDVAGSPGAIVETTLQAENLSDWAGGRLAIVYDPAVITEVTGVMPTGLAADFTVQFSDDQTGTLQVALANDMPVSGTGELLKLGFRLAADAPDGTAPLVIAKAQLNDLNGRDFATSALQQAITRNNAEVQIDGDNTTPPPTEPEKAIYLPIVVKE